MTFHQIVSDALTAKYDIVLSEDQRKFLDSCIGKASLNRDDLGVLYHFASAMKPTKVIEIGLATGSSAVCNMLSSAATITNYVVIDPFQSKWFGNRGITNLRSCAGNGKNIVLHEERSFSALPKLLSDDLSFDYAFIDGSHMFDETLIEFFFIDKLLKIGGVIVMDDRPWPMVGAVISFIQSNYVHYEVDDRHPRLTFLLKKGDDDRRWYDFRRFEIPQSSFHEEKIRTYQKEQGTAFTDQDIPSF